jgi:hypothetical protein
MRPGNRSRILLPIGIEMMVIDEYVIDDNVVAGPGRTPSPAVPRLIPRAVPCRAIPPRTKIRVNVNGAVEVQIRRMRRVIPSRIGVVNGSSPDPVRIIDWHIDNGRIRGKDFIDRLARIFHSDDLLFCGCRQFARSRGPVPHSLYGVHHIAFLSQKRISKVRRPGDVFRQVLQDTWKNHESLDAGIPVLTQGCLRQRLITHIRIALQPLTGFDNFKRVRCGDKNLADQWIRIERNRCDQIVKLIR